MSDMTWIGNTSVYQGTDDVVTEISLMNTNHAEQEKNSSSEVGVKGERKLLCWQSGWDDWAAAGTRHEEAGRCFQELACCEQGIGLARGRHGSAWKVRAHFWRPWRERPGPGMHEWQKSKAYLWQWGSLHYSSGAPGHCQLCSSSFQNDLLLQRIWKMLVLQRWLTSSTRGHPYDKTGTEQGESLSWLHSEVSQSLPRLPGPGLCWWWGQAERQALKERKISQQLLVHLPVGFIPWSVQMFVSVVHLSTGHPRTPHRCPTTLPCLPVCSFPIRLLVSSLSLDPPFAQMVTSG